LSGGSALAGAGVVVTGGAGAIGAAIARELLGRGAGVVLADRDGDRLDAVARSLGAGTLPVRTDVTHMEDVEAAVALCGERFGRVHAVVANAAIGWFGSFEDAGPEEWRRVLDVNVVGTALTLRGGLAAMKPHGRGHLVVTASVSGVASYPGESVYIASKWAVMGLARALRLELAGSGVRMTTVLPGLVDTPMARRSPVAGEAFAALEPLQPEDVAAAVGYALSQPDRVDVNEVVVRPHGQGV
jgi:NADP-dependent 3-hydroxy acid dehydrogenase YdfG